MSPRRSVAEAQRTRSAIVERAVDVASEEGLEGLTIGRLAADLEMSKAGVLGHFGSKEALQVAAVEEAVALFAREVWEPVAAMEPGLDRLAAVCDAWIDYLGGAVFPGGCFFTAASCEFDARGGPVRDRIEAQLKLWRSVLRHDAKAAVAAGDLPPDTDPAQIAFELNAIAMGANQARQMHGDPDAMDRARRAMRRVLGVAR